MIILGILVLILILLFLFLGRRGPAGTKANLTNAQTTGTGQAQSGLPLAGTNVAGGVIVNVNGQAVIAAAPQGPTLEDNLKKIAINFTERFGSFSNQNQFENILDLEVFMSEKMKIWAKNYIAESQAKNTNTSVYYGITTKAIRADTKSLDEKGGQAELLVATQRWEAKETRTNIRVFYQTISIKFVFENKAWKVDSATWK